MRKKGGGRDFTPILAFPHNRGKGQGSGAAAFWRFEHKDVTGAKGD